MRYIKMAIMFKHQQFKKNKSDKIELKISKFQMLKYI